MFDGKRSVRTRNPGDAFVFVLTSQLDLTLNEERAGATRVRNHGAERAAVGKLERHVVDNVDRLERVLNAKRITLRINLTGRKRVIVDRMRDGTRIVVKNRLTQTRARSSCVAVERPTALRDRAGLSRDERLEVRIVVDRQKIVLTDRLVNRTVRIGDRKRNVARTGKRPNPQTTEFFGRRTETELAGKRNRAAADVEHVERIDNRSLERDVKRRGATEIEVSVGKVRSIVDARGVVQTAHSHLNAAVKAERTRKAGRLSIGPLAAEVERLTFRSGHNKFARAGKDIADGDAAAILRESKRTGIAECNRTALAEDGVNADGTRPGHGNGRTARERPVAQIVRVVGVNMDAGPAQFNSRAHVADNSLREGFGGVCIIDNKLRTVFQRNRPCIANAERIVKRQIVAARERQIRIEISVLSENRRITVRIGITAKRDHTGTRGTRNASRTANIDRTKRL